MFEKDIVEIFKDLKIILSVVAEICDAEIKGTDFDFKGSDEGTLGYEAKYFVETEKSITYKTVELIEDKLKKKGYPVDSVHRIMKDIGNEVSLTCDFMDLEDHEIECWFSFDTLNLQKNILNRGKSASKQMIAKVNSKKPSGKSLGPSTKRLLGAVNKIRG